MLTSFDNLNMAHAKGLKPSRRARNEKENMNFSSPLKLQVQKNEFPVMACELCVRWLFSGAPGSSCAEEDTGKLTLSSPHNISEIGNQEAVMYPIEYDHPFEYSNKGVRSHQKARPYTRGGGGGKLAAFGKTALRLIHLDSTLSTLS